ncbi:MAG: hypothetical protein DRI56_06850 [Chloroflexota bacterium]|nr:MAG: hypothetical protein B6243_01940 [Anaerolineaceae bacterium 4572_5.2]RLD07347.1 MAG: hypothetical protein DRI56_06850 [Chloroflexota bacterium]
MPNNEQKISLLSRYQRLIKIAGDLTSKLDLDILLLEIVKAAADITGAEAASILLYDAVKEELYFQAATNLDTAMRGMIVPLHNSIAGWIVRNREPIIIDNPQEDDRHFQPVGKATQLPSRSLLGVPLITKEKMIGVLEAINKKTGVFTLEDQEVLIALGSQAAVAIENSRLFQQSDLIGEFVHELRTPLSSLSAATHLLRHPRASQEQKDKMFVVLETEINRLAEMSTSFLDLARMESGRSQFKFEKLDLRSLLRECSDLVEKEAKDKRLDISLEISEYLPDVYGDHDKMKQAIINLLSNAIKYNKEEGQIILRGEGVPDKKEILIMVSDTGVGISEEHIEHIFEKFYRVPTYSDKVSGTGLGLAVVEQIIDGHGGYITVESEFGIGTTFAIHLPSSE